MVLLHLLLFKAFIFLPRQRYSTNSRTSPIPVPRQGKIINFASIAGQRGNAIAPSWFETNMGGLLRNEPQYQAMAMRRVPLGRMGQPDELIGTVLYLASDASSMVTGHLLAVDGGTLAA
jgi:hypothetical protein